MLQSRSANSFHRKRAPTAGWSARASVCHGHPTELARRRARLRASGLRLNELGQIPVKLMNHGASHRFRPIPAASADYSYVWMMWCLVSDVDGGGVMWLGWRDAGGMPPFPHARDGWKAARVRLFVRLFLLRMSQCERNGRGTDRGDRPTVPHSRRRTDDTKRPCLGFRLLRSGPSNYR